jgi:hypothetical protein
MRAFSSCKSISDGRKSQTVDEVEVLKDVVVRCGQNKLAAFAAMSRADMSLPHLHYFMCKTGE